jgi:hypothetical protein
MARPGRRILLLTAASALLIAATVTAVWPLRLCPQCIGFTIGHTERTRRGLPDTSGLVPCERCDGRGRVSLLNEWFGPAVHD